MTIYLQYGGILIFATWVYIMYRRYSAARHIARTFNVRLRYILTLGPSETDAHTGTQEEYIAAVRNYKRTIRNTFRLWLFIILLFCIGAFVVGILTHLNGSTAKTGLLR